MKATVIRKLFAILAIIGLLVSLVESPVRQGTIIIAAFDSSNQWKSQAMAICTGTSDQNTIDKHLTTGSTMELAPGTYNCSGPINIPSNSRLYGQGDPTVINLQNAVISIIDVNDIELDHFMINGTSSTNLAAIFLCSSNYAISDFIIHDIKCKALSGLCDFEIYSEGYEISNVVFCRCDANNPDGFGFFVSGEGKKPFMQNMTFYKCTVENAGLASNRTNVWATGFDFGEASVLTINRLQAINCSVNGAWESDFHLEDSPTIEDLVITGCTATNAGQKPSPVYGQGYMIGSMSADTGDIVEYGNTASNNTGGDLILDGTVYTPIVNGVSPINSTKTATEVNKGNCSGVIVNTDSTHKELVLYTNNGKPVNQQLELGNYFVAYDGGSYTFTGKKIVVQFTNYIVIRLVESNMSPK